MNFGTSLSNPQLLDDLVTRKKHAEYTLMQTAEKLSVIVEEFHGEEFGESDAALEYQRLRVVEETFGAIWTKTVEAILEYEPSDNYEFGLKISTLAIDLDKGLDNPRYLKCIIEDSKYIMRTD